MFARLLKLAPAHRDHVCGDPEVAYGLPGVHEVEFVIGGVIGNNDEQIPIARRARPAARRRRSGRSPVARLPNSQICSGRIASMIRASSGAGTAVADDASMTDLLTLPCGALAVEYTDHSLATVRAYVPTDTRLRSRSALGPDHCVAPPIARAIW